MDKSTLHPTIVFAFSFMVLTSGMAMAAPAGHELLFMNAQNATGLTAADRKAIYAQFNFNVGADAMSLVFSDAEQCPPLLVEGGDIQVATEDLNGDQYPEVFVSLGSTCMFGVAGNGVSLFIKDKSGRWQSHDIGAGMYSVQETKHLGYADILVGGPGFCHPILHWDGRTYVFHHKEAEQPDGCDGQ